MKSKIKLLLLAVMMLAAGCAAWADVAINATNFPDSVFREYVSQKFDTNTDGTLNDSEIASVTDIYVQSSGISSMKGIEHFTALKILHCYSNQLTALDLDKNTALTELECHDNKLTLLDLSKNTDLIGLYCAYNQLTIPDVSKNTKLRELSCQDNKFTELDISYLTDLTMLICDFIINRTGYTILFNIADFMKAYKFLDDNLLYVDLSYVYLEGSDSLTIDVDTIATNNVVSFTIPSGKSFGHIQMTLTCSNSQNKTVRVYPASDPSLWEDNPSDTYTSGTAPIITTVDIPAGSTDAQYSQTFTAYGDTPITWTLTRLKRHTLRHSE